MKPARCSRAWQAEAVEDGRLRGSDAASFERHATTCEWCAGEARALAGLRRVAARLPILTSTPLERRRQRRELLRRADEFAARSPRAFPMRALAVTVGAMAVAAAVVLWLRSPDSAPGPAPAAADVPSFQIATSKGAEWRTLEHGSTLRLSARRGRFELAVERLRAGQRFLIELPDGELEVQGTRFVVNADGMRTLGVRVLEGRVSLRLREHATLVLSAREEWSAEEAASSGPVGPAAPSTRAAAGAAETAPPASEPGAAPPGTRRTPPSTRRPPPDTRRVEPDRAPVADAGVAAEAATSRPGSAVGRDFAEAMSAFSAGDYGRAEQLLVDFERNHSADARVEDAMFLRAVAHARRGDRGASRAVALEYLRRYPNGLRRAEAERLAK